ncbi:helix-turn-helix domain-containing protein [Streptomyces sp. SD11]|uniref:helix-turn-helix domain-containing protein n=1 Tax=Streptomyces sp. SD11 TaxID=3452209 RepID=UPI003F8B0AB6
MNVNRRVEGLRREEVAALAGISVEYYIRLERGDAPGVSENVLLSVSRALRLDESEHAHLLDPIRSGGGRHTAVPPRRRAAGPPDRVLPRGASSTP